MVTIQIPASVDTAMSMIGYEPKTTFWMDFSIADKFGIEAIVDTFNHAFKEWHTDHIYLTELVMVLNHKRRTTPSQGCTTSFGAKLMSGRRRICTVRSCNTSTR